MANCIDRLKQKKEESRHYPNVQRAGRRCKRPVCSQFSSTSRGIETPSMLEILGAGGILHESVELRDCVFPSNAGVRQHSTVSRASLLQSLCRGVTSRVHGSKETRSMRNTATRGALFALAFFFALAAAVASIPKLDVVSTSVDPKTQQPQAKLFNAGQKTIIATTLAVTCPGGTAYAMEDQAPAGEAAVGIRPGDTAERQLPCSPATNLHVTAVVYADKTAEGDPAQIAHIFASRKTRLETLKAERIALAESSDVPTAIGRLRALKGLDQSLIQNLIRNMEDDLKQNGASQYLKDGYLAQFDRELPAAEASARRAQ
jgi:hypothetical protein